MRVVLVIAAAVLLGCSAAHAQSALGPYLFAGLGYDQMPDRNLVISAISVHGNPLHPNAQISHTHHTDFLRACELAAKLEVPNVITLSGCPGSDPKAELPSWVVSPLPPEDFYRSWEWQWNEKVIPYWRDASEAARRFGVRVAIEMVPNMVVFNVESLLKLREAIGETIGANLDPSHLFWQGADMGAVIRALGDAIYHFHAKDSAVNPYVAAVNGVLDPKPLTEEARRSWLFRTVGTGHGQLEWSNIFAQLRLAGYDTTFSSVSPVGPSLVLRAHSVPGWQAVRFDADRGTVRIPPGVELDLGATGKGLAADLGAAVALDVLEGDGGVLLSLGGDLSVAGAPPEAMPLSARAS